MNFGRNISSKYISEKRVFELSKSHVAKALLGLYGLAVLVSLFQELGAPVPEQVRAPLAFLALTFVPGGLIVLLVYTDVDIGVRHLLYAFGISLMTVMAIGLLLNITLPLVGYLTPMAWTPLVAAFTVFVVGLTLLILRTKPRELITVSTGPLARPVPLALLLLPLLSIIGVELLNRTGSNLLIIIVLVIVSLLPLIIVTKGFPTHWHSLGVWTLALAVLYHKALWKFSGYSGQPYAIRIWRAKLWTPGVMESGPLSAELLPNGILYPVYARLLGVHILTQYNVINPAFVSFLPLALFVTFRRYTDSYKAFLGASLFVFAHPFFRQYPTAGRAATPVLFLALFGVAISDRSSSRLVASGLGLLFVLGIVVSHYGTSYYVMAAFGVTLLLLAALRWFDQLMEGGVRNVFDRISELQLLATRSRTQISLTLVVFYSVSALTWYMYIHGGKKFELLPKHAKESYFQLIGGSTFSGRTAARIQKDYGTLSVQLSKYIYMAVGVLIILGLLVVLYRRLWKKNLDFDDHYYAFAAAMLGIFMMTVMVRNWGGGRPMMITYVATAIFPVIGIAAIEARVLRRNREALQIFGVLLAVLFILNSGVASAVLLSGFAPSNVPNQDGLAESSSPWARTTVYKETDIATHLWMINHYEQKRIYGDTFANRQADWYRPQITLGTRGGWAKIEPRSGKPLEAGTLAAPGVEPGYILLLGHNIALDGVWAQQYGHPTASLGELELRQRSKVYTTGESAVYYYNDSVNDSAANSSMNSIIPPPRQTRR